MVGSKVSQLWHQQRVDELAHAVEVDEAGYRILVHRLWVSVWTIRTLPPNRTTLDL